MDIFIEIQELKKSFCFYKQKKDFINMTKILQNIKNLHGKNIIKMFKLINNTISNNIDISDHYRYNNIIESIISSLEKDLNDMNDENLNFVNEDNLNDINKKNLTELETNVSIVRINKKLPSIILFHAEWCNICVNFMNTWDAFEKIVPPNKCNILKISCSDSKTCENFDFIDGYPTIVFVDKKFNNRKIFNMERSPTNLIYFLNTCMNEEIIPSPV